MAILLVLVNELVQENHFATSIKQFLEVVLVTHTSLLEVFLDSLQKVEVIAALS